MNCVTTRAAELYNTILFFISHVRIRWWITTIFTRHSTAIFISHFSILTANHTFISFSRVLPSCAVLYYMPGAQVYLQIQPISCRKHNNSIIKTAALVPAHASHRIYLIDNNQLPSILICNKLITDDEWPGVTYTLTPNALHNLLAAIFKYPQTAFAYHIFLRQPFKFFTWFTKNFYIIWTKQD
jgi:hypothetical protein